MMQALNRRSTLLVITCWHAITVLEHLNHEQLSVVIRESRRLPQNFHLWAHLPTSSFVDRSRSRKQVTANTVIRYRARVPEIRPSCPTSKAVAPFLLAPCSRVLLQELPSSQPVRKFPAFYGTRRFITAFTSARHLSLSRVSSSQSIPPPPTS
jgi:hypothetical protein